MLHAGLDLSRRKIDVCLPSAAGEIVEEFASLPMGTASWRWRAGWGVTSGRCGR
jgi:hypothetical protein